MTIRPDGGVSLAVWYAVGTHALWGVLLMRGGGHPEWATGVHALLAIVPDRTGLGVLLLGVAVWAGIGAASGRHMVAPLMAQQVALTVSAWGAIDAVLTSQFADGVVRDRQFIAADQCHYLFALAIHTVAIVRILRARSA